MKTKLSAHFGADEMACKCCGRLFIGDGMKRVIEACEVIRSQLNRPVVIVSGCRCATHNKAVGGAANSRHIQGDAVDLHVDGVTPQQLKALVKEQCPWIKGIGTGKTKFHMDARTGAFKEWTY